MDSFLWVLAWCLVALILVLLGVALLLVVHEVRRVSAQKRERTEPERSGRHRVQGQSPKSFHVDVTMWPVDEHEQPLAEHKQVRALVRELSTIELPEDAVFEIDSGSVHGLAALFSGGMKVVIPVTPPLDFPVSGTYTLAGMDFKITGLSAGKD